jgi:hypothetical protein
MFRVQVDIGVCYLWAHASFEVIFLGYVRQETASHAYGNGTLDDNCSSDTSMNGNRVNGRLEVGGVNYGSA